MRKFLAILLPLFAMSLAAQGMPPSVVSLGPIKNERTLLSLSRASRISVIAISPTGAGISLHDRMEGEIARDGSAGVEDGRIDITLDAGEYRVQVDSGSSPVEGVSLEARAFREAGGETPSSWPRLVPGKCESASLGDLESASYWIELREDGAVEIEALGRDLALVELWREGQYLIGSYPVREERQVEKDRPMGYACASVPAKAGLYLARFHGGASRPWAKDEGKSPLYVRSGFAGLPIGSRLDLTISPFGRDFVRVDDVDSAWISLEAEGVASLYSVAYRPGFDRLFAQDRAGISKDSIAPRCAVGVPRGQALLRIEAEPGTAISLDAFRATRSSSRGTGVDVRSGGLLTVLAPRSSAPELPITGLAYRLSDGRAVVAKDFAAPLTRSAPFRARCNLADQKERTVFLRVEEEGDYQIAEKDGKTQASANYALRRLGPDLGPEGRSVDPAPAWAATYSLSVGYYVLSLSARSLGVLDFAVQRAGIIRSSSALSKEPAPARRSLSFSFDPDPDPSNQGLLLLASAGLPSDCGFSFAPLPLRLDEGLSLELGPREGFELPAAFARRGSLRRTSREGTVLLGGQAPIEGRSVPAGGTTLSVRNDAVRDASPGFAVQEVFDDLPAPRATSFGSGATLLAPGSADWRDFGRSDAAVYCLEVKESAVYVIETLGRLSTSLSLRTAARLDLFRASANGYGRNGSIRAWLRPGQYYITAATTGRSAGRGALRADRVPLAAEVSLDGGAVDRREVPADAAARFSFSLPREGEVELRSIGLGGAFSARLEDEEGFIAYRGEAKARLRLAAGRYRLYSLPASIATNRLTWVRSLSRPDPKPPIAGTRALSLNEEASATWSEGGAPDRWSFEVPSPLEARLALPDAFDATLSGPGGERELEAGERRSVALERGVYSLSVRPRDRANQVAYSIGLYTAVLAPGVAGIAIPGRPSSTRVSVPADGFYELWSLGRSDVSATLVREGPDPEVVARSDDNGPDWNFDIVQRLKAGYYRLDIEFLADRGEPVELRLDSRAASAVAAVSAPFSGELAVDGEGIVLPFTAKQGEGLYLLEAGGEASVASLRLYRGDDLIAAGEGRIVVPLRGGERYSAYAWTPLASRTRISVRRLAEKEASMSLPFSLEAGEVARLRNREALSAVAIEGGLLVSPGLEVPCADPGSSPFSTSAAGGWAWAPDDAVSVAPLALSEGEGAVLALSEVDQGFSVSSSGKAILVAVDTRGQFRCGVSAAPDSAVGGAPYDWDASATWSQGSLALLPPGSWKARVWDGERAPSRAGPASSPARRVGLGLDFLELRSLPALKSGDRETLSVPPGAALAVDVPACTLSVLMGRGLVLSAWKDGEALATRSSQDGRAADTLALKACRLLLANRGSAESSLRLAVLPARASGEDELSASRPFESVDLPPEGVRLGLKASEGDLLCLAGDECEAELETSDGRYVKLIHDPAGGLFSSVPASSGSLRLRSVSGGLARAYLAKGGRELDGLVAEEGSPSRALVDAATLSGKGDGFRLRMDGSGYVDLSCPGPGVLALGGKGLDRKVVVSGSREDMHLFAWLPAGDYTVWQRPARGAASGGILRADRIESREAGAAGAKAFVGAREYQAWSFEVKVGGTVGIGIKAERDGLEGFVYDSRQGLVARGALSFPELDPGSYLLVVKGLDDLPMEYELALLGLDGSRLGVPPEVVDRYKAASGASASVSVPLRRSSAESRGSVRVEYDEDEYLDEGDYESEGDYYGE